jgi:phage-related minor tail protein
MSSAIDNFVRTGKLSMKDLARSIIQDLIAIQMKAAALSFLRMMFAPTMGPSIDGGGALDSSFNQYLTPKAAFGGTITGPTIVGEKGPELFMPSGSGTIIPNSQMNQMGGTTNVTNNYINAIDTKSFEERLYGSSNAIWAANQYANKSLAVNRGRA